MNISDAMMLPVGTLLDRRYRIERYIASGGFGNTYLATDTRVNGRVVLKEFFMRGTNHRAPDHASVLVSNPDNAGGFAQQLDKFRREAQRIFHLRNDHIVHVSDLFDANGTSYYVMDFIEGETLSARVGRGALSEAAVLAVADQLLDALGTVHAAGFYHLDVKPGNIMIDGKDHCTLIDFGASKQMSATERTTLSVSGMAYTPGYAPIEQEGQRTKSIGPWTDFYAVGATLYHLLTARKPPEVEPYDTADDGRMFDYPAGVSQQLRRAVSRMMNPDIRRRPQNVEEMRALLFGQSAASATTVKTPTDTPPEVTVELQSEKRPKWGWIAALCGIAAVVVAFLLLRPSGGNNSETGIHNDDFTSESFPLDDISTKDYTVNGVSFTMVDVDGGSFDMGSDDGDSYEKNKPVHRVSLSSYAIGETEVTQALWQAVMGNNPSKFTGDSNLPVEWVSWDDCQTFINKLNSLTEGQRPAGRKFRLPTEAEWEFAARGGNNRIDTEYSGDDDLSNVGWYSENSDRETHPVKQKASNDLGLYDMSGNVWEWCQDWYDEDYYSKSPENNPRNDTQASYRVFRGGSWDDNASYCRVAYRYWDSPGSRGDFLGLRLAL